MFNEVNPEKHFESFWSVVLQVVLASKHVNHSINPKNKIKTLLGLFKREIQLLIYFLLATLHAFFLSFFVMLLKNLKCDYCSWTTIMLESVYFLSHLSAENHILEDVNKCVIALQEGDVDTLDRTAGAIRGRAARVVHIINAEMENYEPGVYTERVLESIKLLSETGEKDHKHT